MRHLLYFVFYYFVEQLAFPFGNGLDEFIYYPAFLPSQSLSVCSSLATSSLLSSAHKEHPKRQQWIGVSFQEVDNFSLLCRLWSNLSAAWNLISRTETSSRTVSCRALPYGLRGRGQRKCILSSPSVRAGLKCHVTLSRVEGKAIAPADAQQDLFLIQKWLV